MARAQPRDADPTAAAVAAYAEAQTRLRRATLRYVELVTGMLDDAGINYLSVTGRTKSVESFAAKAARTVDGQPLYPDPLTEITDQVGLRVITYIHSDVAAVAELLADELVLLDDRDMGQETASEGRFGYASRHLLVGVAEDDTAHRRLRNQPAQVQIRTVLQHAWAEFEHDIRYKGSIPEEHRSDFDRRFTLAAGLLELADREFSTIRDRLRSTQADQPATEATDDPRLDAQELAAFLAGRYADAGWSRVDHYDWIGGLLLELGITSLEELGGMLAALDEESINTRMAYKYPAGAVRRLDDALLAVFGDRYISLHGNAHRVELLQARLERIRTPQGRDAG